MDDTPEMINIETFAERMGISRAIACEWKRTGILVRGRHYIQHDRIIRFPWGQDLICKLLEDCVEEPPQGSPIQIRPPTPSPLKTASPAPKSGTTINWDYNSP
jgi:hypothetical protein